RGRPGAAARARCSTRSALTRSRARTSHDHAGGDVCHRAGLRLSPLTFLEVDPDVMARRRGPMGAGQVWETYRLTTDGAPRQLIGDLLCPPEPEANKPSSALRAVSPRVANCEVFASRRR